MAVVDLAAIRARLDGLSMETGDYGAVEREFRRHAPADLAALLAEVGRLEQARGVLQSGLRGRMDRVAELAAEVGRLEGLLAHNADVALRYQAEVTALRARVEALEGAGKTPPGSHVCSYDYHGEHGYACLKCLEKAGAPLRPDSAREGCQCEMDCTCGRRQARRPDASLTAAECG